MSDAIISVTDLRYSYRKGTRRGEALAGLSFSVERGEIFGVLGPNGAGKTTLVRILATILPPASGRAVIAGCDVAGNPLGVRRSICAVLQESAVETLLSVWDNLLLYGYLHGYSRARTRREAERVVELLELKDSLRQRALELSGGYKRRLQVAKALMVDTPVLFLDEATTGMDPLIKRRTMDAFRDEAARGRTVLLTTQLLDEAEALCDRMILIDQGKMIAGGRLSELRARSTKVFSVHLSFTRSGPEAVAAVHELGARSIQEDGGEYELVVEGQEDEWLQKLARLSASFPLARFEVRSASLEQIFVELYGGYPSERGAGA